MKIDKILKLFGMKAEKKRPTHPVAETQKPMKIKEKIQIALQKELEPLGYKYIKTLSMFRRKIDHDTFVGIIYEADCFYRDVTYVNLRAYAEYRDIEKVLFPLIDEKEAALRGHFAFSCRLQWLMTEGESAYMDFRFTDKDDEDTYRMKMIKLIERLKTILLPYVERLTYKDGVIKEASDLDSRGHVIGECAIPVMYCVWKHDKQAALDYLEEKRQRLFNNVEPWEWDRVEAFRNGECFNDDKYPISALSYLDFMTVAEKFKKWADEQEWD